MKTLILFGAGASHGCGGLNKIPPIGKGMGLFCALRKNLTITERYKYRNRLPNLWRKVDRKLRDRLKNDIEGAMKDLLLSDDKNALQLLQELAIFFSIFKIEERNKEKNKYYRFIKNNKDGIVDGNIILTTINYDCIIENAMELCGLRPYFYGDDNDVDAIKIIKVHGSCNFFIRNITPFEPTKNARHYTIQLGGAIDSSIESLVICDRGDVKENTISNISSVFPVLCQYTKTKDKTCGKSIIDYLQQEYNELVSKADHIVFVGVGCNEHDNHLYDAFLNSDKKISIVGKFNGDKIAWEKWRNDNNIGDSRFKYYEGGFNSDKLKDII